MRTISFFSASFYFLLTGILLSGCSSSIKESVDPSLSVPSTSTGDSLALDLARKVEDAVGGKDNWNKMHYIKFEFFGSRRWFWDKYANRYRVESDRRNYRIAGTLDGKETYLWLNGQEVIVEDSIKKYRELAFNAWINDTYWLIMPFKLSDPGVHLTYIGRCIADSLTVAECIELTFDSVGVTPENKYKIYVDTVTHHVIYWDYFNSVSDSIPTMSNAWTDYQPYGKIKLSSGRGERSLTGIKVFETLPDHIFTNVSLPSKEIWKE